MACAKCGKKTSEKDRELRRLVQREQQRQASELRRRAASEGKTLPGHTPAR